MLARSPSVPRSILPLVVAPFAASIYYLAIKAAFAQSIDFVFGSITELEIDLGTLLAPEWEWGSHWFYRSVAEILAASFAIFVAAGLAHGRERVAAIVAGCTISLGFLARMAGLIYYWKYLDPADFELRQPWHQYAIDGVMIFLPPIIATVCARTAVALHQKEPKGFGGINRLHFLWLWIATFYYGLGLIAPAWRILFRGLDNGVIAGVLTFIAHGIAAVFFVVPAYFGLALLSGNSGSTKHPAVRNLTGVVTLLFGFVVGSILQYIWYWVLQQL